MSSFNTIQETWVRTEGVEGAIGKPLVASAEAKPLPLMAQSTPPQSHSR